ncbi:Putative glutathione S-transferase-related transmembrane protein [Minicystis rosea]|nr:Putative glutathione S-transferase-related transmembrane protein [Minicystis rosea]
MSAKGNESANDGTTLELPSDREILITRSFSAPTHLVFEAMTRPEHVKRWWSPRSRGVMLVCDIDLRVGGGYRYVMRTNDGMEVGFSGKYLEIDAPHRVVQTEVFDPFPDSPAMVTVTLTEHAGTTKLASLSRYPSKEVRDMVISTGMESGMRESMLQLSEVVASIG